MWLAPSLAYAGILLGTACLGLGFGLSGAPLNSYPPRFFPVRRDTAIVALHTALGLGLAAGPLLAGWAITHDVWGIFPVSLLVISLVLMLTVMGLKWPDTDEAADLARRMMLGESVKAERPTASVSFWIFFAIAILSVLMICAFLLLPYANTPALGIGLFAFSGLACSAFFPLTVGLISKRFDMHVAWVSSMMIAALMFGNGIGSFLIGLLRSHLALEQLYRFSSLYPLLVLIMTTVLVRYWRKPRVRHVESARA